MSACNRCALGRREPGKCECLTEEQKKMLRDLFGSDHGTAKVKEPQP